MEFKFDGDGNLISVTYPRFYYKYIPVSNHLFSMITENYLWFSKVSELNDPFEWNTIFDSDVTDEEIKEYVKFSLNHTAKKYNIKKMQDMVDSKNIDLVFQELSKNKKAFVEGLMSEAHKIILKDKGLCCFSEDKNNVLMWAHYANNFQGVCLVYDFDELYEPNQFVALKVQYLEKIPKFNYIRHRLKDLIEPDPNNVTKSNTEYDKITLATKTLDWSYEKEYRLMSYVQGKNNIQPTSLKGIIFGNRTSEVDILKIKNIAIQAHPDIAFTTITLDTNNNKIYCPDFFDNQMVTRTNVSATNLSNEMEKKGYKSIVKKLVDNISA